MKLRTGDILHCKNDNFISKAIRFATKGKFSHTALVVECWGEVCIIEAQNNGVNLKTYDSWMKKYNYKYAISRPLQLNEKEFSVRALKRAGVTSYDFKSLLFYQPLYILTGKWKGSNVGDNKMYCSDFVGWQYDVPKYWEKSPQDLYEYLCKLSTFETINL